jgi:glycosyltransferase involved in cell wall biosynthesis
MISVVIPCLNEVEFIDATLESLLTQEPPGVDWEVIVADGGSTDGTGAKLESWSKRHLVMHWIENPRRTTPHALNEGIEAAKGDVLIILGAHAEVSRDWLLRNHQVLHAHPESGCVGWVEPQPWPSGHKTPRC